jgi:hypothetical protein
LKIQWVNKPAYGIGLIKGKVDIMTMIRPWGMGTTVHDDGETGYGFPETTDPNKFNPDYGMCTKKEIQNHKLDLEEWNKTIKQLKS